MNESYGREREQDEVGARPEEKEEASVADATRLSARLIYEVIRRDGEKELERPNISLVWSGLAAGLLISASVIGQAILRTHLPTMNGAFLVECLGYSLGFMIVILGRMQLFTENTITTVLPAITRRSFRCFLSMLRLWGIVLAANVVGALVAAGFMSIPLAFSEEMHTAILEISRHAVEKDGLEGFVRAIPAGVLVAAIVWVIPSSRGSEVLVILFFTWAIAAGEFTHVIAGSVEMGYLLWTSELGYAGALLGFFLPVLAGNVVGGTVVFTLLSWGQVKNEVAHGETAEN